MLLNLLSTAVEFTHPGGCGRVTLSALRARGQCVEIGVRDTGAGIAPEQQELVFERVSRQAKGDYVPKGEGTCLGPALARRFVALHGGTSG